MKTKEQLEQEAAEGKTLTPELTPEDQAAKQKEADKLAALARELGIPPEELESAKAFKTRKKEVEAGFSKVFDQKKAELQRKEEELLAREKKLAERPALEDAPDKSKSLKEIKAKFKAGEIDEDEMADQIEDVHRTKQTTQEQPKDVATAVKQALQEFREEMKAEETAAKQEQAMNGIAAKLATKHGCKQSYARAIFQTALEESGDASQALKEATEMLGQFSPKKTEIPKTKQPLIKLQPAGAEKNESHVNTIDDAISASVDSLLGSG